MNSWCRGSGEAGATWGAQACAALPTVPPSLLALQGTLYITLSKSARVNQFEVWRICYFLAGWVCEAGAGVAAAGGAVRGSQEPGRG
jgi:hypothetical protein